MFHLDADWDADGRVSGSTAERAARAKDPGLILVANLDVDGRRLPDTVKLDKPQVLDSEQRQLPKTDDEAKLLLVVSSPATPPLDPRNPWLVLPEPAEGTFRLLTPNGQRMIGLHRDDVGRYPVHAGGNPTARLDAVRLPGSPLGYAPATTVTLEITDAAGAVVQSQTGTARVAPLILSGDLGVPQRLYMCLDPGENDPSVAEVTLACALAGVPFVGIPVQAHGGDTWIQDQFQVGYCQAPGKIMPVLLHMPRVRSGFVLGQAGMNLAAMVDAHFPSTNLGVCRDFWKRQFKLTDVAGKTYALSFADSGHLLYVVASLGSVFDMLFWQLLFLGDTFEATGETFSYVRVTIPEMLVRLRAAIAKAKPKVDSKRSGELDQKLKAAEDIVAAVEKAIPLHDNGIGLPVAGTQIIATLENVDTFTQEVLAAHDSVNYGGNVEIGPSTPAAPAGKIVVGGDDNREMDADLFKFFSLPQQQPVVRIDTAWLDVGHVDELISFVPDRNSSTRAAVLRAGPEVALRIIRAAGVRFLNGLGPTDKLWDPYVYSGTSDRRMNVGRFPVTMMFRGKHWLYRRDAADSSSIQPPRIYQKLHQVDLHQTVSAHRIAYAPGPGPDRYYPAAISIMEFLDLEEGTNDTIATEKIEPLDKVLASEFPNCQIVAVPVLFDLTDDLSARRTSAFSPDLVNVQILGNVIAMPRPYGPRVPLEAAPDVLREVLPESLRSRATKAVLSAKKLDVTVHWTRSLPNSAPVTAAGLADDFRDGFPKAAKPQDIAKAILKANPAGFTSSGELKPGWQRLIIPEGTVDLFQAYTELVTEPLGVVIQWTDSWYYHVAYGGIHCATNVLRRPQPAATPWWQGSLPPSGTP